MFAASFLRDCVSMAIGVALNTHRIKKRECHRPGKTHLLLPNSQIGVNPKRRKNLKLRTHKPCRSCGTWQR